MIKISRIFLLLFFITCSASQIQAADTLEKKFITIQKNPQKLHTFLQQMPKGGDLHIHLGGASIAENMIAYGQADPLCVDPKSYVLTKTVDCAPPYHLATAAHYPEFYHHLIDAWSMRNFKPGLESGHDHFFATFGKYLPISTDHTGEMLIEVVNKAASENILYLELMVTPDSNASGMLGQKINWDPNLLQLRKKILASGLKPIIETISKHISQDEKTLKTSLYCGTPKAKPGCELKVRYLYQILREQPPTQVFAQLLAGFEVAAKDHRFVGINMVQPEDGKISMRDYNLQMMMVGFLHRLYPSVNISLHAGELVPGLVPADGLRFHIRNAIELAHAKRIGHGVDVAYEDHANQLLDEMAKKQILVEINLISNDAILNVKNEKHPILLYLKHGVPVALSTDDPGVLRTDMTAQYEQAVLAYRFSYATLKNISRNSLFYSFLPGKNLWLDARYQQKVADCQQDEFLAEKISPVCQSFLTTHEKAALQWMLEKKFAVFEKDFE